MASKTVIPLQHRYFPVLYNDADFPVGVFASIDELAQYLRRGVESVYQSCRRCVVGHKSIKLNQDLNLFMIQEDEEPPVS